MIHSIFQSTIQSVQQFIHQAMLQEHGRNNRTTDLMWVEFIMSFVLCELKDAHIEYKTN